MYRASPLPPPPDPASVRAQFGANIRTAMNDRMKKLAMYLSLVLLLTLRRGHARAARSCAHHHLGRHRSHSRSPSCRSRARCPPMAASTWPQVIQRDLESSGRFKGMARTDMVFTPTTVGRGRRGRLEAAAQRLRRRWAASPRSADGDRSRIDVELVNVLTGQRMLGPVLHRAAGQPAQCRASRGRRALREDHRRARRVRHAHRLRVGGRQAAEADAIELYRRRCRRREPRA